jgi:hypothetical protein
MTALSLGEIPSHINSLERLAVWVVQALQNVSNGEEVNVTRDTDAQLLAQCSLVTTADGVYRAMLTAYLPIDQAALNDSEEKTWMAAQSISNAAPHVNFMSN